MKAQLILSLFLGFSILSCEEPLEDQRAIELIRAPLFEKLNYDDERLAAADFLEDYLNLMFDSSVTYRNTFWQSNFLYSRFDCFLKLDKAKSYMQEFPPILLGIRKDSSNHFHLKLAFEAENVVQEIMNLELAKDALGEFYFLETLGENLKSFQKVESQGIEFYYSPSCEIDSLAQQKVVDYSLQLANYFETSTKYLRIIVCKDLPDYAQTLGLDYAAFLNFDKLSGGRAFPDEDLFISANGSPYYPHELVHMYSEGLNPNPFFDEGLATYLGGSGDIPLVEHLEVIAPKREEWDFSKFPEDFYLYEGYQGRYLIGGMLMKLADEEYGGKEAVFELLQAGKERADFLASIQSVFSIDSTELDAFIKAELAHYEK